jgi:competence ComEA-like helix-hairpin-helix protein
MSDSFKEFVERREAAIKTQKSGTDWTWILLALALAAVVLYLVFRGDPSTAPVNPNTASIEALITLPGVGPEMAEKIVAKRSAKSFTKPDDLLDVQGIGPKTLDKMKPRLKFE